MEIVSFDNSEPGIGSGKLDEAAFERLYRMYWQRLYDFALCKVHDRDVAEEIIQDLFVTIWDKRDHFVVSNLKSYLFVSVRNRVIDYYKQRLFSDLESARDNAAPDYPLFLDELEARLHGAIDELPTKTREIFVLSKIEGKNAGEISKQLDLPLRTVEYHVTQAVRRLRTLLKNVATCLLL